MKNEYMRIIHFSGKLFGYTKATFRNLDGEESFIESRALLGVSVYKVSQNNLRAISEIMSKGEKYFDDKMVSLMRRIELEKDEAYIKAQKEITELRVTVAELRSKNSKLSAAVMNLQYSARTVMDTFKTMDLEE